jgi:hypothetical protein
MAQLKLVPPKPTTEQILRDALIGRDEAMRTVSQFDAIIAAELKALAKERGVIFLRPEAVRRELGL